MIFYYILIWVMPLTRHPLWSSLLGDLTLFKYLGAICFFYALFHLISRGGFPNFFRTWSARGFFLLYLLAGLSYFTKTLPSDWEFSPFLSYSSFLVLFFITLSVVDTLPRLRWVLLVAVASVAFASLYVIREWQKYHSTDQGMRPGWVTGDPNYFTLSALVCLPLGLYLLQQKGRPGIRVFCFGSLLVTLVAISLAASRGGFLGLLASSIFIIQTSRKRVRNLALLAAALLPLVLLAPSSPVVRFLHPNTGDQQAAAARKIAWVAGMRMIEAHPIAGIGLGNFKPLMDQYADPGTNFREIAHNTYIELAAELGIPGLLIFLFILISAYRTLGQVRKQVNRSSLVHQAALGLQAGLVGYMIAGFCLSAEYQKLFWLALFLSMCLPLLAEAAHSRCGDRLGLRTSGPQPRTADESRMHAGSNSQPAGGSDIAWA